MKYYIDANNTVYAYESDGSQDAFILPGLKSITAAQAVAITNPPLTAAQAWSAYQAQAESALSNSDKTILRCAENAVPVPSEWAAYRKALRGIVGAISGTPGQLPVAPAYPAGT
jgi:hypothetical protein